MTKITEMTNVTSLNGTEEFAVVQGGNSRAAKINDIAQRSVKGFGAVGNGTTDDSSALQAALDWWLVTDQASLYFPRGQYLVNTALTVAFTDGVRGKKLYGDAAELVSGLSSGYISITDGTIRPPRFLNSV